MCANTQWDSFSFIKIPKHFSRSKHKHLVNTNLWKKKKEKRLTYPTAKNTPHNSLHNAFLRLVQNVIFTYFIFFSLKRIYKVNRSCEEFVSGTLGFLP